MGKRTIRLHWASNLPQNIEKSQYYRIEEDTAADITFI